MAQTILEAFSVTGMDNQTAVAVQSLIESQSVTETPTVDEDDVFQCGKCKKQFTSLGAFVNHKQTRCMVQRSMASVPPNLPPQSATTNPVLQSVGRVSQPSLPAYNAVPPSPLMTQNMVLTDDLMSFANVDQTLGTSTLQLQGASVQPTGPFLSQVATFSSRSPNNVTIINPVNSTNSLPSSGSAFTNTVSTSQIQLQPAPQQITLTALPEKQITTTVNKPSPTKAGRKTAQAQAGLISLEPISVVKVRRGKNGNIVLDDKRKLRCQYCDKLFSKNFDLQQHIRAHTGEKPFQCIVCGRAFAQKSNVKKHMNTHKVWPSGAGSTLPDQPPPNSEEPPVPEVPSAPEPQPIPEEVNTDEAIVNQAQKLHVVIDNSYVCQYCSAKFKTYFQLKSHMVQHKSEQVYKCSMKSCKDTFRDLDLFLEHIKVHENELTYRCHLCNKFFPTLYELGLHQYSHSLYPHQGPKSGPRHFQCTKCMNKYSTPEALEHHMNTSTHNHPCPHCNKTFTCERYLRRHLPSHGSEGQFQCTTCQKKFKAEHYLKMHMLIHSGETPFACEICSAAFNRKDKLKRHMLIHETVKRYKCPFRPLTGCIKEFSRPDKLKAHIISHCGVRPYKCRECGRCFSRKPHLIEHERGHRADYKFKCEVCQKGFFRPKLFREHKCVPLKPGESRVYRPRSKRKVGRPRKRMICVKEEKKWKEDNSTDGVHVQNEMTMNNENSADESEKTVTQGTESDLVNRNRKEDGMLEESAETRKDEDGENGLKECIKSDNVKQVKPEFCVKVSPPPPPRYLTVNLPGNVNLQNSNNNIMGQSIQAHFIQTAPTGSNLQNIVSSHPSYQPITIIEAQPMTMTLPMQVGSVENVTVTDALPLQMTAMNGGSGPDNISPHMTTLGNVSVGEIVPVHVTMPPEEADTMVATHVVVTSSGSSEHGYVTCGSQLEDFGGTEGDPVLQGTENILKAHAEILQSAQ